jgi:hypothetical protein
MRHPVPGRLLVAAAFGASAVAFAWVAAAISITGSACDSDANSCYGVPAAGVPMPWGVVAALPGAVSLVLLVLCVRSWRGQLREGTAKFLLASMCGLGAVVAAWGYERSNVYFNGGVPYRQGHPKWWVAALLVIPPLVVLTALMSRRLGSRRTRNSG